jgi:hypothetical protein
VSERDARAAQRAADREKIEVAKITKTLIASRDRPKSKQEQDIEEMLQEKRTCEKELARCTGDAGAPR